MHNLVENPQNVVASSRLPYLFYILLIIWCGCGLSPGRKVIPEGQTEIEFAVSVLPENQESEVGEYSLKPYMTIGFRHGISKCSNIGMTINPSFLLLGTVYLESYLIFNMYNGSKWFPALNGHITLPLMVVMLNTPFGLPAIGLTPSFKIGQWRWYTTAEYVIDFGIRGSDKLGSATVRSGVIFPIHKRVECTLECGVVDLGGEPIFMDNHWGQGIASLGLSFRH